MDVFVSYLNKYKFVRLTSCITPPIIVHSVPGAGKSSLIRELINSDKRFSAFTFGKEDCQTITGVRINKATENLESREFCIFDEYLEGDLPAWAFAAFADPLQGGSGEVQRAHFTKEESHRFGKCTAQLLRELNFSITASGEDIVQIRGLYEVDPQDTIIFYEREVGELLRAHCVEAFCIRDIRGQTFDSVTFVTANSKPIDRELSFQCLTRHRRSLLILSPDASYTAC
uniref:Putative triple gene block 1 protein n=1 Tax=Kalanchoe latent virus TaxID=132477 RepID=C7AGF7_9VIRU|nr:putative triple gene block 1 protein [Kalanchoe latent virus]